MNNEAKDTLWQRDHPMKIHVQLLLTVVAIAVVLVTETSAFPYPVTLYRWDGSILADNGWVPGTHSITANAGNLGGCSSLVNDRDGTALSALELDADSVFGSICMMDIGTSWPATLSTGGSIAFGTWVQDISAGVANLFSNKVATNDEYLTIHFYKSGFGYTYKESAVSSPVTVLDSSAAAQMNSAWYFVTLVVSQTSIASFDYDLYLDGVLMLSFSVGINLLGTGESFHINGDGDGPFSRILKLDDTALWQTSGGMLTPDTVDLVAYDGDGSLLLPFSSPYITPSATTTATVTASVSMTRTASVSKTMSRTASVSVSKSLSSSATASRTASVSRSNTASTSESSSRTSSVSRSLSSSATSSRTASATSSATSTSSPSASSSASASATASMSATATSSVSATETASATSSSTSSRTASVSRSSSKTISDSPTRGASPSKSGTVTGTNSATSSNTASSSVSSTATTSSSASTSASETASPSASPSSSVSTSASTSSSSSLTATASATESSSMTSSSTASSTATPSSTASASTSASATESSSVSATMSSSESATATSSASASVSATASASVTATASPTESSSSSASPSATNSATSSTSATATASPTSSTSVTASASASASASESMTSSVTATATSSGSPSSTASSSQSASFSASMTSSSSATETASSTTSPTASSTATSSSTASMTMSSSSSPSASVSASATSSATSTTSVTATVTASVTTSASVSQSQSASATSTSSPSSSVSQTMSSTSSVSATVSVTATETPSNTVTSSETATTTVTPSVTPTVTPVCRNHRLRHPECTECVNEYMEPPFCIECLDPNRDPTTSCLSCRTGYISVNGSTCQVECNSDCAFLNRTDACVTPNTCGECLPGYSPTAPGSMSSCRPCLNVTTSVGASMDVAALTRIEGVFAHVSLSEECRRQGIVPSDITIRWWDNDRDVAVERRMFTGGNRIPKPDAELTVPADQTLPSAELHFSAHAILGNMDVSTAVTVHVADTVDLQPMVRGGTAQHHRRSQDLILTVDLANNASTAISYILVYYWSCRVVENPGTDCPFQTETLMPVSGSASSSLMIPASFPLVTGEYAFTVLVTDGALNSAVADVTVTISQAGPRAMYFLPAPTTIHPQDEFRTRISVPFVSQLYEARVEWALYDVSHPTPVEVIIADDLSTDHYSFMFVLPGGFLQAGHAYSIHATLLGVDGDVLSEGSTEFTVSVSNVDGQIHAQRGGGGDLDPTNVVCESLSDVLVSSISVIAEDRVFEIGGPNIDHERAIYLPHGSYTMQCAFWSPEGGMFTSSDTVSIESSTSISTLTTAASDLYQHRDYPAVLSLSAFSGINEARGIIESVEESLPQIQVSPESMMTAMNALFPLLRYADMTDTVYVQKLHSLLETLQEQLESLGDIPLSSGRPWGRLRTTVQEVADTVNTRLHALDLVERESTTSVVLTNLRQDVERLVFLMDAMSTSIGRHFTCGLPGYISSHGEVGVTVQEIPTDADLVQLSDMETFSAVLLYTETNPQYTGSHVSSLCRDDTHRAGVLWTFPERAFTSLHAENIISDIAYASIQEYGTDMTVPGDAYRGRSLRRLHSAQPVYVEMVLNREHRNQGVSKVKVEEVQCVEWSTSTHEWELKPGCTPVVETVNGVYGMFCQCMDGGLLAVQCPPEFGECGLGTDSDFPLLIIIAAAAGLLLLLLLLLLMRKRRKEPEDVDEDFVMTEVTKPPPQPEPTDEFTEVVNVNKLKTAALAHVFANRMKNVNKVGEKKAVPLSPLPGSKEANSRSTEMWDVLRAKALKGRQSGHPAAGSNSGQSWILPPSTPGSTTSPPAQRSLNPLFRPSPTGGIFKPK